MLNLIEMWVKLLESEKDTHTIALFLTLVSSSIGKLRRKQEETAQRFNRISCTGRATLDHSFPFPHLFLSLFLSL